MDQPAVLNAVARSHLYWGRSDARLLTRLFRNLKPGDLVFDRFCGGGTPMISILQTGAKAVGSDLNPMAIFMSRVMIQSVSLTALIAAFETIRTRLEKKILNRYTFLCPECGKPAILLLVNWKTTAAGSHPFAAKGNCPNCGFNGIKTLTDQQIKNQIAASDIQPDHWYPESKIPIEQPGGPRFFHELFTNRNLACLSDLFHEIQNIPFSRIRETFEYIFTAMLHGCSNLQRTSKIYPHAPAGWTASGFRIPKIRQEKNVWQAFQRRFHHVLRCRQRLNACLGPMTVAGDIREFKTSNARAALIRTDYLSSPAPDIRDKITHLFLDPPYNSNQNTMALSQFWGAWLKMEFDTASAWHPPSLSKESNRRKLAALLSQARENYDASSRRILLHRPNSRISLEALTDTASDNGFKLELTGVAPCGPGHKTKTGRRGNVESYFLLVPRKRALLTSSPGDIGLGETDPLTFINALAFLYKDAFAETIPTESNPPINHVLHKALAGYTPEECQRLFVDPTNNRKAYNQFCLELIRDLAAEDGYRPSMVRAGQFDPDGLEKSSRDLTVATDGSNDLEIDFILSDQKGNQLLFSFHDADKIQEHRELARAVQSLNQQTVQKRCFLVIPDKKLLDECRKSDQAANWPGGFFLCAEELIGKAILSRNPEETPQETHDPLSNSRHSIRHFKARVLKNTPIGTTENPSLFKLQVETPDLKTIAPGQFVMVDTLPWRKRKKLLNGPTGNNQVAQNRGGKPMDIGPTSFLKRPFGIQQVHYPHVKPGFFKYLHLPKKLGGMAHLAYPDRFDIVYQIVQRGIGTNELKTIMDGSTDGTSGPDRHDKAEADKRIFMLGPLGKPTDITRWHERGIEEIHLIGGGVGMAPLIFFAQALKRQSFRLKAFIGMERLESLKQSPAAGASQETGKNSILYVSELSELGITPESLFISTEILAGADAFEGKILPENYHHGLVTMLYSHFLRGLGNTGTIGIITCGPTPMMKALKEVISGRNIPMKVLMEKRMGCGIGVCMSCVCRTKTDGKSLYSRVCVDGPLFDATHLDWKNL